MSNSGIRPKSLRVKTRLKPRANLLGASTRRSKPAFKFAEKSISEFLSEHPLNEFLEAGNNVKVVKLLTELAIVIKSSKNSELLDDNNFKEIFARVSPHRCNDDYRVRTLTIRIVRLCTLTNDRVILLLQRNFFVTLLRGLDLIELGEDERTECLKLVSKLLGHYYAANSTFKRLLSSDGRFRLFFRYSLKCLLSIALTQYNAPKEAPAADANPRRDESAHCFQRLSVTALGILLEAAAYEPFLVVQFIGTDWLVQCFEMFYSVNVRISSFAHQIFAKWLDSPHLREFAELHLVLQQVSAPFIDLGFFQHPPKDTNSASFFKMSEGLEACAQALSDITHTWSGLFACIGAEDTADHLDTRLHASSPLRIIPYLGLSTLSNNGLKMRNVIVDACCEFIGASYASKTFSNWQEAVSFYSQMHLPDGYKHSLRDDFVVGEMTTLMGNRELFPNETDLLLCFRSVTAFALIQAGIIQALCRLVVMNPDDATSIKATLLLSDFLNLTSTCLPREWRLKTMAIPELIRSAAENFSQHSNPHFASNANEVPLFSPRSFVAETRLHAERRSAKNSITNINNNNIFGTSHHHHHRFFYNNNNNSGFIAPSASNNVENSFSLFNRLDKLTEISLLRNSSPLLDQLQDINVFLLNGTSANGSNGGRTQGLPFSSTNMSTLISFDSELSAFEQFLLDVTSKLYLNVSSNSAPTSPTANLSGDSFTLGVDPTKKESSEADNLQSINWLFVDQFLQIFESTRPSAIAETLQKSSKLTERCHTFFTVVCNQFLPSNHLLIKNYANSATNFDVLHAINCGRRAFSFAAQQISAPSSGSNTFTNSYGRGDDEFLTSSGSVPSNVTASSAEQAFYLDLIQNFAVDFCAELSGINTYTGTFTPKNLLNTNALYYFSIIRILSQHDSGFKILEKSGLFQIFFDLILNNSESIEYTKLIVTSLNYARPGVSRVILQTAISSNDKKVRKWTTRFLNILIGLSGDDRIESVRQLLIPRRTAASSFGSNSSDSASSNGVVEFAFRLAIRQLSDAAPKIVRQALQILIDWLPHKPAHIGLLELVNTELYGNAGRILEAIYYEVEENMSKTTSNVKKSVIDGLEYWMKEFNERYVEILEEEMRRLGLNVKRSVSGRFGRSSHAKAEKCSLAAPPHLLGSLARHNTGRKLLIRNKIVQKLVSELRAFLDRQSKRSFRQDCHRFDLVSELAIASDDIVNDNQYDELRCRRVKAALLALAQIVRGWDIGENNNKHSPLLTDGLALIVEFASRCEWLTVRGCAFWALNIAGCSEFGAKILRKFGWECASTDLAHISSFAAKTASNEGDAANSSIFVIGKHFRVEENEFCNSSHLRQRSRSVSKFDQRKIRRESHFLRRSVSNSELFSGCEPDVPDKTTPTNSPRELTTQLREYETSFKYLFLSESEQTRLISYRNLLAEIENDESNTAEEDFAKPRTDAFTIKAQNMRIPFPTIHLPAQITSICMNVFSSTTFKRRMPYKTANSAGIHSHSTLNCLHCSAKGRKGEHRIPDNVCDANKRRGTEILRLVNRLQIRVASGGGDKNDESSKSDKNTDGTNNEKQEDLDKTNSAASTQTRLLRIYSEFPDAFEHPCLFSNVLAIITDSKLNSAHRRFIHQLFWRAQI